MSKMFVAMLFVSVGHTRIEAGLVGLVGEHLEEEGEVATVKIV